MALSRDGHILGVKDIFLHDTGAYDPYGLTIPLNTQCHAMGRYDITNFTTEVSVVFTNKTLVTPVRGAGRPQGIFVIERLLDIAARELGIDSGGNPPTQSRFRRTPFPMSTPSSTRPLLR